jgi:hypothetical protein
MVSVTDPYGRNLGFLYRSRLFFFQVPAHEAEWTPFQTHYFSENLVTTGIEPEIKSGTLTTRAQRRSFLENTLKEIRDNYGEIKY